MYYLPRSGNSQFWARLTVKNISETPYELKSGLLESPRITPILLHYGTPFLRGLQRICGEIL